MVRAEGGVLEWGGRRMVIMNEYMKNTRGKRERTVQRVRRLTSQGKLACLLAHMCVEQQHTHMGGRIKKKVKVKVCSAVWTGGMLHRRRL